ncbi:MAG: putative zinc-binding peptidase, partial [Bacteroidota bacterium]
SMVHTMKLFACQKCDQLLYFENVHCERCGSRLGFSSETRKLLTLTPKDKGVLEPYDQRGGQYRYCSNAQYHACNWLVPSTSDGEFCAACQFNRTIPNLSDKNNLRLWQKLEVAKHRLIYSLLRMKLSMVSRKENPDTGLAFDFLADPPESGGKQQAILTGHAEGLITINIKEANDAQRVKMRQEMGERYRTLLGHFRHEVGHYYWQVLIADNEHLAKYRRLFGDEREDYGAALKKHYEQGPRSDWRQQFISSYASTHSWEDWAETWAHYLHIVDTVATAYAFGLQIEPRVTEEDNLTADIDRDPYQMKNFDRVLELWLPLTIAMNSINRSMGQPDMYPFVISDPVTEKLRFIHDVCKVSVV